MEHFLSLPYAFKVRAFTVRGTLVSTVRIYSTVHAWNTHVILISYLYYSFYALMFVEPIFYCSKYSLFRQQHQNNSKTTNHERNNVAAATQPHNVEEAYAPIWHIFGQDSGQK